MKWNLSVAVVSNAVFGAVLAATIIASALLPGRVFAQSTPTTPTTTQSVGTDQSTLIVKLKPTAAAALTNNRFTGKDTAATNQLNSVLSSSKAVTKRSLINSNSTAIRAQQVQPGAAANATVASAGDLADYYIIQLSPGEKADDVAAKLKALGVVETAYAKPLPTPAPATASYTGLQTYLKASPTGLAVNATIGGAATAKLYPGATGSKVQIADLEYSWNTQHEDLSALRASGALWANGTPVDPQIANNHDNASNTNHGTAVAGMLAADRNASGVDGIVPNASYHMVNTYNSERGWDVANAVYLAANKMSAGDVILIEHQALAPDGRGFAPIELQQDVYDAIVYATSHGINVIEPAGNGNSGIDGVDNSSVWKGYDLSDAQFGGAFTTARPNSGAIIVGAGGRGCNATPSRARMAFSNYGGRVDFQGPGECVVTTGYGDLAKANQNALYTNAFGGTSAASAAIAGLAAELSSSYQTTNAAALTPAQLKADLQAGGLVQSTTSNPGKIGVFPNMATVLLLTDLTAPTAPKTLTGKATAANKISLSWKPATDNLGYVTYDIYRGGVKLATVTGTSYVDTALKSKIKHTYKVVAVDASGNASAASNSVTVLNK